MKKKYLLISVLIILIMIFLTIFFVEIPSPSKKISENYQMENL